MADTPVLVDPLGNRSLTHHDGNDPVVGKDPKNIGDLTADRLRPNLFVKMSHS
jgi:hypothetical protein